ncbi:MAG: peptidase M29 [Alphaproteobacteria bacterium]|nr:peptidase M29 [Alphaproteobacteria bacterium]
MLRDRIEHRWIEAFSAALALSKIGPGDDVAILSETQSRELNVHLAELALMRLGANPVHVCAITPAQTAPVPIRSTGACQAIQNHPATLSALKACPVIVDVTVEGLMHAPELPEILKSGARVVTITNEHPEALERLLPTEEKKAQVLKAAKLCRGSGQMTVTSAAGTDLTVAMQGAQTVGVWGFTDRPGTLTHWPAGLVVSFPKSGSTNGTLVLDAGDVNLTFKRYLERPVTLVIKDDFVTVIIGEGTDAELMKRYWASWDDPNAYAISHVGWGMNEAARYEAMTFYDQRDFNGTELRAYAGNFLFSTGANEFAGRFTEGHFDIPVRGCTIALDGQVVVNEGAMVGDAFA